MAWPRLYHTFFQSLKKVNSLGKLHFHSKVNISKKDFICRSGSSSVNDSQQFLKCFGRFTFFRVLGFPHIFFSEFIAARSSSTCCYCCVRLSILFCESSNAYMSLYKKHWWKRIVKLAQIRHSQQSRASSN